MDNLRKFIKTKKQNRVYRYSIRRLSIGVVSCVVGAFVLFSPVKFGNAELSGVVYAQNSDKYGDLEWALIGDINSGFYITVTSKGFTESNLNLKKVVLVIDGGKEVVLENNKEDNNQTLRKGRISFADLGKKFKVAIYSISQGSTPTYYVGGKLETGKFNQPLIKEESNVEKEKLEKEKPKILAKINRLDLSDTQKGKFREALNKAENLEQGNKLLKDANDMYNLLVELGIGERGTELLKELGREKALKLLEKIKEKIDPQEAENEIAKEILERREENEAKQLLEKSKELLDSVKVLGPTDDPYDILDSEFYVENKDKENLQKAHDALAEKLKNPRDLYEFLPEKTKLEKAIGEFEKAKQKGKLTKEKIESAKKELDEKIKEAEKLNESFKDKNLEEAIKKGKEVLAKAEYKDMIIETNKVSDSIVKAKELNALKEEAKKEIDELKTITDKSKNLAKKLIDKAKDKEEIGKIVDEAKRLEDRKQKEKPGQIKYTLKIKKIDKDGNVISLLKTVEDLTAEKLNEETEKFVDGADYKDETGNYKVVGTVEMDGTTAVVKVIEVFTVTFDSNGGSQVAPVVAEKGKEVTKPEEPTREGLKFERWELEGKEYDFTSPVEKNITLKAVWSMKATPIEPIEMVTVTFDSNGGTPVAAKEVQKGKAVAKPEEPTREGLTFERWELEGKEYDFTSPVEKNITLKAVWSMKATPLVPGIKKIPAEKIRPIAIRNDNDQMGSIDWRYIKAPSKDAKTEVQKQKTVIEVKIKIGSDILQRTINNHTQEIKMDTTVFIKDGRTMLPIRYVAEALGYTVEWREDTRTAILKDKNTTIEIPVDTNKIIVSGKEIQSDVKPMIENGRTMLPIANVARALGLKDGQDIKWDEAKQEVTIRKEIIN